MIVNELNQFHNITNGKITNIPSGLTMRLYMSMLTQQQTWSAQVTNEQLMIILRITEKLLPVLIE